jgi:glycerol-3-phosphate acyltransferase PlsY
MPDPSSFAQTWPYYLAALAAGYLCGSIPFGLLLTRMAGFGDVRAIGSGSIGATNVLRTGNKRLAALTLFLDAGKGALPTLVGYHIGGLELAACTGFAAFIGHLFPVWLAFKGGKGVATAIGVLLGLNWVLGLMAIGIWLVVAAITRYSSLAALLASLATPVLAWLFLGNPKLAAFTAILALLIWIRHAGNIRRLLRGEESRIGGTKA